jgi:O-antigen/teichoic acid export membrane protein
MPYSWPSLSASWKHLLRRSSLVLALKVAGALAGYAFAYVALQRLGAGNYGYFELAFTVLSILSVVAKWGLDGLLLREIPARDAPSAGLVVRQGMWVSLWGSVLLASALWIGAGWISSVYGGFVGLWHSTAYVLPIWTLIQVWSEVRRAQHRYLAFGLLQNSILLGSIAMVMALIPWFSSVERVLWGLAFSAAIFLGRGWSELRPVSLRSLWAYRATATSMFLTGTLFMVLTWTDTLMLGYFLKPEDVGAYRVAFKIATLVTFAQFAVNASLGPRISELWSKGNRAELQREVRRVAWVNAALGIPAFVGILGLAPWLLGFFSADFLTQAGTLRVLALGQVVNALCGPVMYLLNMTGHEKSARQTMTVAVVVNLAANLVLIPALGVLGAAWATSGTMILWNVWALVAVYRKTGIRTLILVR